MFSEGGFSGGGTPVPIPNTAVKLTCADGTAWVTMWESRTPPSLNTLFLSKFNGLLFRRPFFYGKKFT